jgi:DNA-binding PadR family transcriptional regulator
MPDEMRLSRQTVLVLSSLRQTNSEWRYGYDISRETGLKSGTLYPILMRLTQRKWLHTRWEHTEPGRPPRHMYRLSAEGARAAREFLREAEARGFSLRPAANESGA